VQNVYFFFDLLPWAFFVNLPRKYWIENSEFILGLIYSSLNYFSGAKMLHLHFISYGLNNYDKY